MNSHLTACVQAKTLSIKSHWCSAVCSFQVHSLHSNQISVKCQTMCPHRHCFASSEQSQLSARPHVDQHLEISFQPSQETHHSSSISTVLVSLATGLEASCGLKLKLLNKMISFRRDSSGMAMFPNRQQ